MSSATMDKPLSYEEERGKPMPSFNHGAIQMNLGGEFMRQRQFRILSELTLNINGKPYTPDLSVYARTPLDLRHDVSLCAQVCLVASRGLPPEQAHVPLVRCLCGLIGD